MARRAHPPLPPSHVLAASAFFRMYFVCQEERMNDHEVADGVRFRFGAWLEVGGKTRKFNKFNMQYRERRA